MYQVEDKPETIHLYVVREGPARPPFVPIVLSLFTLSLLLILGITVPYTQPVTRLALRVPAVPLFIRSFTASVAVVPTGVKTYPPRVAHGSLSIRNGSVIAQVIPAGFVISGVATDAAAYVPGATAEGDGIATVSAHSLTSGINLSTNAVNVVIGTSLFIRNPQPFAGGRPAYSVKYVTEQDKQTALIQARSQLAAMVNRLHYPCQETKYTSINTKMYISWLCQFVTYHIPAYMHVSAVQLSGKNLLVAVWFIAPQKRIWAK